MKEAVNYIIRFLLHDNEAFAPLIGYTNDSAQFKNYKIVIRPSFFFETPQEPSLPLLNIENIPLLFGTPKVEIINKTLVVDADIVASSYYLLTRYEEMLRTDNRDQHGRYIGKLSLPAKANFMHRPIVDEYGLLLLKWLKNLGEKIILPPESLNKIYLTHDVDTIANYRHLRGQLGGLKRWLTNKGDKIQRIITAQISLKNDPAYTFPWLMEQDKKIEEANIIYFFKAGTSSSEFDYPMYNLQGKDAQQLLNFIQKNKCKIGLHASYSAGKNPNNVNSEINRLQKVVDTPIFANRYHYLRFLENKNFEQLVDSGITDDFSVSYADIAGFRLGTCRAVKWIEPQSGKVSDLTLHPLTAMDCSLSDTNYMSLDENQAFEYCKSLIYNTKKYHGDLCLLWHNSIVNTYGINQKSYHKQLYANIIDYLKNLQEP